MRISDWSSDVCSSDLERSLNIDFLLGWLKRILPQRPDLKVIVTSATLDPEKLSKHFNDAPILFVSGRTYPVEQRYRPLADDGDQEGAIASAIDYLWRGRPNGDVLVSIGRAACREKVGQYGWIAGVAVDFKKKTK